MKNRRLAGLQKKRHCVSDPPIYTFFIHGIILISQQPKLFSMSTKPIQTEIFRFVTMRSPNHLGALPTSSRAFIYPPIAVVQALQNTANAVAKSNALNALATLVAPFAAVEKVRNVNPDVYDFSCKLYQKRSTVSTLDTDNVMPLTIQESEQIWSQLLYQAINAKSSYVRQACVQMLLANHYLTYFIDGTSTLDEVQELFFAKVVIPEDIIAMRRDLVLRKCETQGLMGVTNLGIADFRRVEQELCCYVPGEVSHIENVMKNEYKERSTRNLTRSETTLELGSETEIENLTDTTTATRHELSSEIAKVLTEDQSQNYGGSLGVSGEKFGVKIDVSAHLDFASANSSSTSNTQAEKYGEDVTKRALERVIRKTTEKRTFKMLREFEETNRHGFDNRGDNAQNISAILRWTDKVYKNQVVNYGKRLMLEFVIPEPARFLKNVLRFLPKTQTEGDGNHANNLVPPIKLAAINTAHAANGITKATDITRANYEEVAALYGITIPPPLQEEIQQSESFNGTPGTTENTENTQLVTIPMGYEVASFSGTYSAYYLDRWLDDGHFHFYVHDMHIISKGLLTATGYFGSGESLNGTFSPRRTGSFSLKTDSTYITTFAISVLFVYKLQSAIYTAWQTAAYTALQAAYQTQLDKYNSDLAAQAAETAAQTVGAADRHTVGNPCAEYTDHLTRKYRRYQRRRSAVFVQRIQIGI
jgi:hypothetical protein